MTKNRKTKRSIRAAADRLGINYTTARRETVAESAHAAPVVRNMATLSMIERHTHPHIHDTFGQCVKNRHAERCAPGVLADDHTGSTPTNARTGTDAAANQSSAASKAALGPFTFQCGTDLDGRPAYINFGDYDSPPLTWVGGHAGAGKTALANHLARIFLEQSPNARVLWLSDTALPGPLSLYWPLDEERATVLFGRTSATNEALIAALLAGSKDEPTLVVIDDGDDFLAPPTSPTSHPDFQNTLQLLATLGRSHNVRTLITSHRGPTPTLMTPTARDGIGTRIWLGEPSTGDWATTFGSAHDEPERPQHPEQISRTIWAGHAWVQRNNSTLRPQPWLVPKFFTR